MQQQHRFEKPTKRIHTPADMATWRRSQTYADVLSFLRALNGAVLRVPTSHDCGPLGAGVAATIALLDALDAEARAVEPLPATDVRFGNPAFREWHAWLVSQAPALLSQVLRQSSSAQQFEDSSTAAAATEELSAYLCDAFGNPQRIDYGTGHELAFVALLMCLRALGVFGDSDREALVTRVFARYLQVARLLQTRYRMEPAGSHGVWGLDDHQFVPFIFGSAQLVDHAQLEPGCVLEPQTVARYADQSLYLDSVAHIYRVKSGPFAEHSPDLYNISAAASWRKINGGMFRKYEDDVLMKWPIVQHFFFGSILRWPSN